MVRPRRRSPIALLPPLLAFALWMGALGFPWFGLPSLGQFLSPFEGFWRNAEVRSHRNAETTAPGLVNDVTVEYDVHGVPHVFGGDDLRGLFFAQGYVTARDRLWQMDIQSRAGLGRLAEVLGPDLLRVDLERRRMGMPAAARASLELARKDSLSRVALEAYADGVNLWINAINKRTWPLEFKLLDYAPEAWSPLKTMALIGNMKWILSQGKDDLALTRVADSLGEAFFQRHYPDRHPGAEPMLPEGVIEGTEYRVKGTGTGDGRGENSLYGRPAGRPYGEWGEWASPPSTDYRLTPNPASGSNSFVLSGARTRSGSPLLANDPHLDLTLPSAWYAIQLHGGGLNAYGVSLPGVPGVVIGFTRTTAWGVTNGMDDVFDWVELEFRGDTANEYRWDNVWRLMRRVPDTIAVRGAAAVVDTQLWTHLGPVPVRPGEEPFGRNTPPGHALQWTALQPSNELGAFLRILSARDYPAFRKAVTGLGAPSQNFVFAGPDGIALVHQGLVPVKARGQGRRLLRPAAEGNVDASIEWERYIPEAELPAAHNPARGWLAAANQEVAGSEYPHWLGTHFHPPERSIRLHRLLEPEYAATPEWAREVMFDAHSTHAARALPLLLGHLPRPADTTEPSPPRKERDGGGGMSGEAERLLRAWDFRYRADAAAPVYFDLWWHEFYRRAWEGAFGGDTTAYVWPTRPVTLDLLAGDSAEAWSGRVREAFAAAVDSAGRPARRSGDNGDPGDVAWGSHRPVRIPHLLRLGSLGIRGLSLDGCNECVNAQRGTHGPSWRMVVQLPDSGDGPNARPDARGIYPGGQTGNPGSPAYTAFVDDWAAGRLRRLLFLLEPGEFPDSTAWTLTLRGEP